ncbi:MAG TPA: fibronectin type III domain-containing protein [Rectinemataceae bacterium]
MENLYLHLDGEYRKEKPKPLGPGSSVRAEERSLFIDMKRFFFDRSEVKHTDILINGRPAGRIDADSLPADGSYGRLEFKYRGELADIVLKTGSCETVFRSTRDFAAGSSPDALEMSHVRKLIVYPRISAQSGAFAGAGADIGPRRPSLTILDVTSFSVTLTLCDLWQNTEDYRYEVFYGPEYTEAGFADDKLYGVYDTSKATTVVVENLIPGKDYRFSARAVFRDLRSLLAFPVSARTRPA